MKIRYAASAALCALLVACGSDGGSSSSGGAVTVTPAPSTPTPSTPTPSPASPTPTPSSTPTYVTYDALTGDQTFRSSCGAFVSAPPSTLPSTPFGSGLTIAYAATSQTYAVTGNGLALTFGPGDIDPNGPSTGKTYVKLVSGSTTRLRISGSSLSYTRPVQVQAPYAGGSASYFCVIGVPTLVTDVPPIAAYSFTVAVGGTLVDATGSPPVSYSLQPTTVSFSVDLAQLTVNATMHLIGQTQAGAQIDLGTYTGSGTLDPNTGSITGNWTSPGREVFGQFGGTFFGPQGREVGLAYNITSRPTGTGSQGVNSAGYIIGTR